MINIFICLISAFFITYFTIPPIIKVASIRKIYDEPDERKLHSAAIPALGGVAIFSGIFFPVLFWAEQEFEQLRWIILTLVINFLLGLKDDIVAIDPYKKLIGQLIAASIIIYYGNIRIISLHGLLSIHELPYAVSIALTLFTIIVIVNSFNLIDGIDGLAGGIGIISSLTFGLIFLYCDKLQLALVSFSMVGALVAFLCYNFSPARIFMGDGGSLIIGFILSILCIKFLNTVIIFDKESNFIVPTPPLALAILIIPLADTLRVFIIRLINNRSPFRADRNHIHHLLLQLGLNHKKVALTLHVINIVFIAMSFFFYRIGLNFLFFLIVFTSVILSCVPYLLYKRHNTIVKEAREADVVLKG